MKKRLDFRFEVPPPPDGPLVELSANEIENLLLKNLDEAGADPTKALWQLAQLKHQVLQRRVAAVGQQRRQNVRDLLVERETPDEPVGGTFVFPKRDTATYPMRWPTPKPGGKKTKELARKLRFCGDDERTHLPAKTHTGRGRRTSRPPDRPDASPR